MRSLGIGVVLIMVLGSATGVSADEQNPVSPPVLGGAGELSAPAPGDAAPAGLEPLIFTPAWKSHQCNPGCIETCWCDFVHCKEGCGGNQICENSCIRQRNSCVALCGS
jgi:hypothetical protein